MDFAHRLSQSLLIWKIILLSYIYICIVCVWAGGLFSLKWVDRQFESVLQIWLPLDIAQSCRTDVMDSVSSHCSLVSECLNVKLPIIVISTNGVAKNCYIWIPSRLCVEDYSVSPIHKRLA